MNRIFTKLLAIFMLFSMVPQQASALSSHDSLKATGTPDLPVLFGAYTSSNLQTTVGELTAMNNWLTNNGASGVTFAGDFISITFKPSFNLDAELEAAWNNGFMPFFNLMPSDPWEGSYYSANCDTAADIASGLCDSLLRTFADHYKAWVNKGGGRRAFVAPLPEANGDWALYSSNGTTFINAFIRIRQIFESRGVASDKIRWVFAPNGWHDPAKTWQSFEYYYPGDTYVDVVAFSAYNFGGCVINSAWKTWDTFEEGYAPYLQRMHAMAPSKPIFISQIGVTGVKDDDDNNPPLSQQTKSIWTYDTFDKLANSPGLRAIIFFNKVNVGENISSKCNPPDYRIYYGGSDGEPGFLSIMQDSRFGKWSLNNNDWNTIAFNDPAYTFADVQPSHPFSGEPNIWYFDYVHSLYNSGITGGCTTSPLNYCPSGNVTRAQMAVFLLKGVHNSSYSPPAVGASTGFADVPTSYWAAAWIKQLAAENITGGCGNGNYCPENPVTRAQMAVFLLRARHGASYTPPPVGASTGFADVPTSYWAAAWIKQLAAEAITGGCGGGNYCPDTPVTRAQMAIFLVKTFNLP